MSKHSQTQLATPVPPFPVDGVGFMNFNNYYLIATIAGLPLMVTLALPVSIWSYPIILAVLAFPSFALFNILWCLNVKMPSAQQQLPGKPIEHYMTILDPELAALYKGHTKIPMNLFAESYFDGKIDVKGDFFAFLEARHDWANFQFTWSQAKFFFTQWVPELLLHSRKQDEDQVREHYDRGNDFYEAFCKFFMFLKFIIINSGSNDDLHEWYNY